LVYTPPVPTAKLLILLLPLTLAACGRAKSRTAAQASPADSAADGWTRAEWLAAAEGFIADPTTLPRLADPATRPLFQRLVSTAAWREVDVKLFEGNGEEIMRFLPTIKRLTLLLLARGTVNEVLALGLYTHEVYPALIGSGLAFVDRLPADDSSRIHRLAGLERMRLGAAIDLCGILYVSVSASEDARAAAVAKLMNAASYGHHSREGLQLIVATLDEKLLPSVSAGLRKTYQAIREIVAQEHGKRAESRQSVTRTTYQGIGSSLVDPGKSTTVVSATGGFSVAGGPAALAMRVEVPMADGSTGVQHRVELQDGETLFAVACLDGKTESELVANMQTVGNLAARTSPHPGQWFTLDAGGREARLRFTTIAGRGCMASAEGPSGQVPGDRADAFLASLRAAP